jgi:hypothetical protein
MIFDLTRLGILNTNQSINQSILSSTPDEHANQYDEDNRSNNT